MRNQMMTRETLGTTDSLEFARAARRWQATHGGAGSGRIGGNVGRILTSRGAGQGARPASAEPSVLPLREVVFPWLVSRLLSDALILVMALTRHRPPSFGGFGKWDGDWYSLIAHHGYGPPPIAGHESPWPFFPLLPGMMRALGFLGVPLAAAGVLISHAALLVGLAGLYRIARRHVSPGASSLAVWACALFPGAFIFSMIYPSSIFIASSVWAFVFVEERQDVAAGAVAVLAVMARPNGFILVVALALAVRSSWRRLFIVCAPSAVAFAGWCLYCLINAGDALAFWNAKSAWPEVNLLDFIHDAHKYAIPHMLLAAAAIGAVILVWRKLPASWIAFTLGYLLPPLFTGIVGLGRYATECFPPYVAAGDLLSRRTREARVLVFAAAVLAQALCAYWVIHSKWLP